MADKQLVEQWYPLLELVVNRLFQTRGYTHLRQYRDDLISEGAIGLISGIDTYDPEMGSSEVSWYSRKSLTAILNYIRDFERGGGTPQDVTLDDIQIEDKSIPYKEPEYELIDKYEPEDEVRKVIYHQILMGNSTYREVAEEFGLTRQAVLRRAQKLRAKLKKEMENDNVLEDRA